MEDDVAERRASPEGALVRFLSRHKSGKGQPFTHTSIRGGSFNIPDELQDMFMDLYVACLGRFDPGARNPWASCPSLSLTEKHRETCCVVIDLDFRFRCEPDEPLDDHMYTDDDVRKFVAVYVEHMRRVVPDADDMRVFVLEKPSCTRAEMDGCVVKDGVHIMMPGVVTRPGEQLLIRKLCLEDPRVVGMLDEMGCTNKASDVFDEAVIRRNNWQMYGSGKPGGARYTLTHVYAVTGDYEIADMGHDAATDAGAIARLLSIRGNEGVHPVLEARAEWAEEVAQLECPPKARARVAGGAAAAGPRVILITENAGSASDGRVGLTATEIDTVRRLASILSAQRAYAYPQWIAVGWCLFNLSPDGMLFRRQWIDFSRRAPEKFNEAECARIWGEMSYDPAGVGMGSLHMWAREDSPETYQEILRTGVTIEIRKLVYQGVTDYDIAKIIHKMFYSKYRCIDASNNWYEFRDHRWHECVRGVSLRKHVSESVFDEFAAVASSISGKSTPPAAGGGYSRSVGSDDPALQFMVNDKDSKEVFKIGLKLKNTSTKERVMKQCNDLFFEKDFLEKLDSNRGLLCCKNGVYDLVHREFRPGRPEDYCSFSTGINYVPHDPASPVVAEVLAFISQVLPAPELREYVLTFLGSVLDGNVKEEKFNIWTGSGSNGKSKLIELFEATLGNAADSPNGSKGYACKFNVSMLTQKRPSSTGTNSELSCAKGKRFAVLQEPGANEELNVGYMKELTGGDRVIARGLYQNPVEFKPQFKMVLLCNHLPTVPADDGGTWRRIRVVEFTSKFVASPDRRKPNEFVVDYGLSDKFDRWKEAFLSIIIEYHKRYMDGIRDGTAVEPECVVRCTREYQLANDQIKEFLEATVEKVSDASQRIELSALFLAYRTYMRDNGSAVMCQRNVFDAYVSKNFDPSAVEVSRRAKVLRGYRMIEAIAL